VARVELRQLSKVYSGRVEALRPIDLAIASGELLVILGPSGSGKSTLLRLIAGLEEPSGGGIWIDDRNVSGVPPHLRDAAMVFQHPALYPHLSVYRNLVFGLKRRGLTRAQARAEVNRVAGLLGLDRLLARRPNALSGGERQRVAIGRALVRQPRLILFDEPFASLDLPLRAALREQVVDLHRRLGTTLVHVTHDQAEALSMGDRVVIMDRGQLLQCGTPREIYERPAHRFVATFVGSPPMNIIPCQITHHDQSIEVRLVATSLAIPWKGPEAHLPAGWQGANRQFDVGVRPEAIAVTPLDESTPAETSRTTTTALIRRLEFHGPALLATLAVGPHRLIARLSPTAPMAEKQRVCVTLDLTHAVWFDQATGDAVLRRS
jgi:multiple sugar transport system ATP-binding protein